MLVDRYKRSFGASRGKRRFSVPGFLGWYRVNIAAQSRRYVCGGGPTWSERRVPPVTRAGDETRVSAAARGWASEPVTFRESKCDVITDATQEARARALFIEPPNSAIVFIGIYSIFHSRSRLETYTHTHTTYDKRSTCHVILFSPRCDVILSRVVIYFFLSTQSKYVFTWWTIMYVVRREWCSDGSIIERSREIKADNAYHGVAESCQTAPKERRSSCSPELQESLGMSIYNSYITVYSLSYSFIHL